MIFLHHLSRGSWWPAFLLLLFSYINKKMLFQNRASWRRRDIVMFLHHPSSHSLTSKYMIQSGIEPAASLIPSSRFSVSHLSITTIIAIRIYIWEQRILFILCGSIPFMGLVSRRKRNTQHEGASRIQDSWDMTRGAKKKKRKWPFILRNSFNLKKTIEYSLVLFLFPDGWPHSFLALKKPEKERYVLTQDGFRAQITKCRILHISLTCSIFKTKSSDSINLQEGSRARRIFFSPLFFNSNDPIICSWKKGFQT